MLMFLLIIHTNCRWPSLHVQLGAIHKGYPIFWPIFDPLTYLYPIFGSIFGPFYLSIPVVVVVVVRAAPDIPEMSVPGVGYSFKPKGLAFVTPLYPV